MRVLQGWAKFLVDLANLQVEPENWKAQWFQSMGSPKKSAIAEDLWKDPECRDSRGVKRYQKRMRGYLTTVAECSSGARSPGSLHPKLNDLIYDLEHYSMKKGLKYFVRVLRRTGTDKEADELFDL